MVCIPFAYAWMLPRELENFSQSMLSVLFFYSNVFFAGGIGYFDPYLEIKPLLHAWSLSIEEQFYVAFPLFLLLLRRMSRRSLVLIVGMISAISLGIAEYGSRFNPAGNFFLLPSRAWELGVGAILALTLGEGRLSNLGGALRQVGSLAGVLLIGSAVFTFDDRTPFPSLWTLVPVIGTALVIACAGARDLVGAVLSLKPVVGIGLISYSAYLWHQPLFAFARIRSVFEPTTTTYIVLIGLTLILAFLSWKFVELPFRSRRIVPVRTLAFSIGPVALLLVAFAATGDETDGFLLYRSPSIASLEQRLVLNYGLSGACEGEFTESPKCRTSDEPEILVWGDSFAMHLVDGILASRPDVALIQHTKSFCGPIAGVAPVSSQYPVSWADECNKFNQAVINYVQSTPTIKYAVLASPFSQYVNTGMKILYDGRVVDTSIDLTAQMIKETVDRLEELAVKAIVVAPPPADGRNIGRCLVKATRWQKSLSICEIDMLQNFEWHRPALALFDKLELLGVNTFSFDDILCDNNRCITSDSGVFLFRDVVHFSKEGSAFLGEKYDFVRLFTGQ